MKSGRHNLAAGLLANAASMFPGFVLIEPRDFAPDQAWAGVAALGIREEVRS